MLGAFAGLTKFAPLGLAPLLWRGIDHDPSPAPVPLAATPSTLAAAAPRRLAPRLPGPRSTVTFVVGYALAIVVPLLVVLLNHDWHWFWQDTVTYQSDRPAPFSIWGLWGGFHQTLHLPEHIVLGATVALGLIAPFWPRGRRTLVEVAALGAAIIIGLQCGITYWFYLYVVWFFPLVVIALVLAHPDHRHHPSDPADPAGRSAGANGHPAAVSA